MLIVASLSLSLLMSLFSYRSLVLTGSLIGVCAFEVMFQLTIILFGLHLLNVFLIGVVSAFAFVRPRIIIMCNCACHKHMFDLSSRR